MRVLIDSSAWIDFLNDYPSEAAERVAELLGGDDEPCTCGLVATEVLQGLRRDPGVREVVALFEDLTFLEPGGLPAYLRAAEIYRRLRQLGQTVRSTVDCLIAVTAEQEECAILARDRDLEAIVRSGLVRTALLVSGEVHEGPAAAGERGRQGDPGRGL